MNAANRLENLVMKTSHKSLMLTFVVAGLMGACATTIPQELVAARNAYTASSNGLASKLTPAELYEAKKALGTANREFEENGDTLECRDYAYVAHRKVELADAKARTVLDRQKIAEAVAAGVVLRDSQAKDTQAALALTRQQLEEERRGNSAATDELRASNTAQGQELAKTAAQLKVEQHARLAAEATLAGAMKDLTAIASVKEEARGVVITLSGSVVFASGKYALLNTAKTQLDRVAEALKAQNSEKRMVVEGHTDSRGSDAANEVLSLNRAIAVRDYLVERGVPADKIVAVGMGSIRPIADNRTADNRANNRRVEIVIGDSQVSAR